MLKKYDEYEYIVNILNTKHFFFFRFCTNVIFVILIQFILAIEFKKKVMFMKSHTFWYQIRLEAGWKKLSIQHVKR